MYSMYVWGLVTVMGVSKFHGGNASDFEKMVAIKMKEEVVEVIEQDSYQMMMKQRDPLESKGNLVWTMKSPIGVVAHEDKQVNSDYMGNSVISHKRDHLEANTPVMERAKEIQANLAPKFPSFIKTMLPSHVTRGFGVNLPKQFGDLHLPRHDTTVHLVNDSGEIYRVNYLVERAARCALSGGWKFFSIANKLLEGDVLVFELVKPSMFKVHIVRGNGPPPEINSVMGNLVRYKGRGALVDQFYDDLETNSTGMKRAKKIQVKLAADLPSFIKSMHPTHVTRKFEMSFPKRFCCLHLPPDDTTVNLVDERGEEYIVNVYVKRNGIWNVRVGEWRKFSIANNLLEGDVLIFQLINPSKFKVYIVRANGLTEGNEALGLLNMDGHAKGHLADQSQTDNEDIGSETSDLLVDFKEIGGIEDFTIIVNGSTIDSELSEYHRTKYYELCRTRNSFLHIHLLETVNCKLAADIISQSVDIVDAIKACKFSTSLADYLTWDKTLEGFALLGMNVGFLRAKISRLLSLASKPAEDSKSIREARLKQSRVEDEMRTSELKLLYLKKFVKELEIERETLKVNAEKHELMFQEEVKALWL